MKELLWRTRREPVESEDPSLEPEGLGTDTSVSDGSSSVFVDNFDPLVATEPGGALDLRGFLAALEAAGRLVRIRERVDWKFGIGRWTRARHKPLLFENVKGYPGKRVFTNGLISFGGISVALGFDPRTPLNELIADAKRRVRQPVKPKLQSTGPVMENVIPASVLDLLEFPVPHWSEYDAGRYLGTWHLNISKDPETGERNAGVYRMQVLGQKQATISASGSSGLGKHLAKAEAKGEELPVAVAIGAPEATVIAAGAACPKGMDEFELAGALEQKSVELIECGHLEVPGHSEIVIEGFIHPGVRVQDGPYFDYYGRPNTNPEAFLFEATRVMHRDNPIFRGTAIGKPGAEDHQLFAFLSQLGLVDFHGSRLKQVVQNYLWKRRSFEALQKVGRLGSKLRHRE